MTEAARDPGFIDPETISRLPRLLAGGTVLAWKTPEGVRLELRRRIFHAGTVGALAFAAFWGYLFIGEILWHRMPHVLIEWSFYVWMSPSIGLFLWVLASALRKARFEADGRRVRVVRIGLFGRRVREWEKAELKDIREVETNLAVNDERQHELVFELVDGRKVRMLCGMSWPSLNAVAAELRIATGLARRKPPPPDPAGS